MGVFVLSVLLSIHQFTYDSLVSLYSHKLDSIFNEELSTRECLYLERYPDIHLKMYVPLKNYSQDITFFPGFSHPILLKNSNTKYGIQLNIDKLSPFLKLYTYMEGYDSRYNSNIYAPTHQRNIYAGIGIQKDILRPDPYTIAYKLNIIKREKLRIENTKRKKEKIFEFKKYLLSYLFYMEKLKYEERLIKYALSMDTILTMEWEKKQLPPTKFINTRLLYLSLVEKFREDSANFTIYYNKIKQYSGIKDSFVIQNNLFEICNSMNLAPVYSQKEDFKFLLDSLRTSIEFYNTLSKCSKDLAGISFGLEIGGKLVMTQEGSYTPLFPATLNISVIFNPLPLKKRSCNKKILKKSLSNKLALLHEDLSTRNTERKLFLQKYRTFIKDYVTMHRELKSILDVAGESTMYINFKTIENYTSLYDKILNKLYTALVNMEKLRSEFP